MDDIKIRVIDSKKLIEAINTGSYEINLSAVMALGAVVTQSASQWIPCSTALPEHDGEYLVTIRYADGGNDDTDLFEYNSHWREWNDGELFGGEVIAWQLKPKPWEGEKS